MPSLVELSVADDPDAWRQAGFRVDGDQCVIGHVRLRIRPADGAKGITSWSLLGVEEPSVDGLATTPCDDVPEPWEHPNGSTLLDHLVLATPDHERTRTAFEKVGFDLRRVREAGAMQQWFYRAGEVILEVIGPPEPNGDRPVGFFGLAVNVRDLDATKAMLGERLGDPKDAVQPGRRIATLRTKDLGITTAIAFMSEGAQEYAT
jgi:hypothetical protein